MLAFAVAKPSAGAPVHQEEDFAFKVGTEAYVYAPEKLLRFSYANNGLAVPAVGGPNHERAGLVLISNLVYQIWQATGEELP